MYDILLQYPVVAIIFMIVVIIALVYLGVKAIQDLGLEKIRQIVYDGFVEAENKFNKGENILKFEHVLRLARDALPKPFNALITDNLLRKTIELWFKLCKNLLDDGRIN